MAMVILSPTNGFAQPPQELPQLPADQPYRHKHSGLVVPPVIDGLRRLRVAGWEPDQLDDAVEFGPANQSEVLTVYVFRKVSGSVPVWFDRMRWQIEHREIYGGVDPLPMSPAIAPPGVDVASGLIMAYATHKGPYRSTGLVLLPLGDWYVGLRYSSTTIEPAQMADHLRTVVQTVHWPHKAGKAEPAALIEECTAPLALNGEAKPLPAGESQSLWSALMASEAKEQLKSDQKSAKPAHWCRDLAGSAGINPASAVYRADGDRNSFIIALNDAGRAVAVFPSPFATLIGDKKQRSEIELIGVARTLNYTSFDALPTPAQAFEVFQAGHPTSSSSTWGKNRSITLNKSPTK
ncbi:hypothetical protein ACLB0R_02825 [Sphingomonas sp. GlSt437]|uniref:hypothetical protein n=1 Tax=Sphingomonas sp. GlSt437 TaxID=3389970 RepID=UPI003A85124D